MISNLNGSGSVRVHQKKRFLPVRGSGSGWVQLPASSRHAALLIPKYYRTFCAQPQ